MAQLDFCVIYKLTSVVLAVIFSVGFIVLFFTALAFWLNRVLGLFFKVLLIKEISTFRSLFTQATTGFIFNAGAADLLEQFIVVLSDSRHLFVYLVTFLFNAGLVIFVCVFFIKQAANFTLHTIKDVAGETALNMLLAWPVLASIFIVIIFSNLTGLLPFSYTLTGSLAAPFSISLALFFTYFYILLLNGGLRLFAGFLPAGTNIFIAPLIVLIEVISTIAKFISLAVRLFANMFAGHLLLKVFYTISFQMVVSATLFISLGNAAVLVFLGFITLLEMLIAFLQAFVLLLLAAIYLKEADSFINAH